jgi:hypothetical protein
VNMRFFRIVEFVEVYAQNSTSLKTLVCKFSRLLKVGLSIFESMSIKFCICYKNLMDNVLELKFSRY